jgi:non-specific serine/threonine protein kinase
MALDVTQGQLTGQRRPGLLPAEATSFVGRSAELAEISALLAAARMVTVAGPAGVGKTRTALRAAAAAAGRYPDGIRLADLGETDDPAKLAESVAMALGLRQADTVSLLRYLRGKRLLLILDTCEHMVEACAALAGTVLRTAPGVSLLATSRQPLDVPGEHAFPLLPLSKGSVAADLFAQRAAAVVPGFALTPENRGTVTRLCARLDGLPLAIELAAIRLRALPLDQLTSRVEAGIRLLTVSRRGTSPRHRTLRAAIEWSHRWCTPAEQALWERLSVFGGGFDVSGAQDVCAGGVLPAAEVLSALVGLVDKSVVLREAPQHGAGQARYRLPAVMREFGADRLAEPGLYAGRLAALTALTAGHELGGALGSACAAEDLPVASVPANAALTRREREIASLVASGLSNRETATRLFISKRTVDAHVEHIFAKLEISSRLQLTVLQQDRAPGCPSD